MAFCLGKQDLLLQVTVYIVAKGRQFGLKITLNTSQYTHHKVHSDLNSAEKKAILLQK